MKRPVIALAFVLVALGGARLLAGDAAPAPQAAPAAAEAKAPSAPGELTFSTHNSVYNAEGRFDSWHFTKIDIPGGDLTKGTVAFEIDLASVNEKSPKLAAHLRTPDFLDAAKFQKATVTIGDVKAAGDKKYTATASVDLHGVKGTCPVSFEVVGDNPIAIKGTATLDRSSFGVGQPYKADDKYAPLNEVAITINAKLAS
jgi:polyisoprenoid-binding protein YceI